METLSCIPMWNCVVGDSPPCIPGADLHATGSFVLASQGAQGNQAVPTTSTPKCPDSTSAKKPSSSKEPISNSQEKSPKAHGSCKCGHSPSLAAKSFGRKRKDVCMEDSCTLNTTLPISSSVFDSLCSPTVSYSDVTELLSPSITLTPLGLASLRHW